MLIWNLHHRQTSLSVYQSWKEKNTRRHFVPAGDKTLLEQKKKKKMTGKDKSYQKAAVTD